MSIKKTAAALFAALLTLAALIEGAHAATLGSHEIEQGAAFIYSVHAVSCPTKILAVDISIYYDADSLAISEDTFEAPALPGAVINTSIPGEIKFNAITVDGFDFSEDSVLASVQFEVAADPGSDLKPYCTVRNFLDESMTDFKDTYIFELTDIAQTSSAFVSVGDDKPSSAASSQKPASSKIESSVKASEVSSKAAASGESSREESDAAQSNKDTSSAVSAAKETGDAPIPSDQAIKTESDGKAKKDMTVYYIIMGVSIAVIIVIAIIFVVLIKSSKKPEGRHSGDGSEEK